MKKLMFVMAVLLSQDLFAQNFGIGTAGLIVPHYMGSSEDYQVTLPFPIFYPEEAIFTNDKPVYLDLHLGLNFPVESMNLNATRPSGFGHEEDGIVKSKSYSRRGMDDLGWALYPGIKLGARNDFIGVDLITSSGFFVGDGWGHAGVLSRARLNIYTFLDNNPKSAQCLCFYFESLYSNSDYNKTYYGVTQADVLSDRAFYNANKSGFLGNKFGAFYFKRYRDILFMAWLNFNSLEDSVIEDSPLVTRKYSGSSMLALGWVWGE